MACQAAAEGYLDLPFHELSDCLEVLHYAITELEQQVRSEIKLQTRPDFSRGKMALSNNVHRLDRVAVFPG